MIMDVSLAQDKYLSLSRTDRKYWHCDTQSFHETIANDVVVCIEEIQPESEYVYDIETEDGTFQCGLGCMIVKNTDSIYTKFILPESDNHLTQEERLEKVSKYALECANRITETFPKPIILEYEKIMNPLILYSKKRYASLVYEPSSHGLENKGKDVKGLQLVKRDYCPYVRKMGNEILDRLLLDQNVEKAKQVTQQMIQSLLQGKVPISELMISKKLRSNYNETNKNGQKLTKPAHWYLAQRMQERDPMNAPKNGDRVQYVYIETPNKHAKTHERIEDPLYIQEHNIKIDTLYYLNKQVVEVIYTLFSVIVVDSHGNPYPLDDNNKVSKSCKKVIEKIWSNDAIHKRNQQNKQMGMEQFLTARRNALNNY
jgi:hypothetical protein